MTMYIEPQTEKALVELAALKNVSVNTLLKDFAIREKEQLKGLVEDEKRLSDAYSNGGITHEKMKAHFETLREKAQKRM